MYTVRFLDGPKEMQLMQIHSLQQPIRVAVAEPIRFTSMEEKLTSIPYTILEYEINPIQSTKRLLLGD